MAIKYPLINGIRHDWSSIETDIGGGIVLGIRSISYKNALEPGLVYGQLAQPIGQTLGVYKPEASMELLEAEFNELVRKLGRGYMAKAFNISVAKQTSDFPIVIDKIQGCRMKMIDKSYQQSGDALVVKVDLQPLIVLDSNTAPIPGMLGIAG